MWAALSLAAVLAQTAASDEPRILPPASEPPVVSVDPNEPPMLPPDAAVPLERPLSGTRRFFFLGLGIGGALVGVGAVFLALSETTWQKLVTGPPGSLSIADADAMARQGKLLQFTSAVFAAAGGVVALTGVGFLLFGSDGSARVGLSVSPTGVAVVGWF